VHASRGGVELTQVSVYTTAEIIENAALFLRLSLPSTLIRHENALRNLETPGVLFRQNGNHFENGAFGKLLAFSRVVYTGSKGTGLQ